MKKLITVVIVSAGLLIPASAQAATQNQNAARAWVQSKCGSTSSNPFSTSYKCFWVAGADAFYMYECGSAYKCWTYYGSHQTGTWTGGERRNWSSQGTIRISDHHVISGAQW